MKFFTAGPSQTYPTLPFHLATAMDSGILSISHRSSAFMDLYQAMEDGLKKVLNIPDGYHVFVFSSATEIWERIALNCVARESFHFVNGNFSQSFRDIVGMTGKQAHVCVVPEGEGFDVQSVEIPDSAELIAAIANESSTGVMMPVEDMEFLRARFPEKLLVVDAVSAVPVYRLDLSKVDGLYFSVQKGFGLPSGLGVLVLSPRLLERGLELEKTNQFCGTYHCFSSLIEKSRKNQTPATPNVLDIFLLGRVCADMAPSMERLLLEHQTKYKLLTEFIETHPMLEIAVRNPRHRSHTVVVANHKYIDGKAQLQSLARKGFEIGAGYGKAADRQFRISNFPATTAQDVRDLIAAW